MTVGIVISTGKMVKTIRVRITTLKTNTTIRKKYNSSETLLVHDEASACLPGDCVRILPGHVKSKTKTHIVAEIVSPVRDGDEERRAKRVVPPEVWRRAKDMKRDVKVARREERRGGVVGAAREVLERQKEERERLEREWGVVVGGEGIPGVETEAEGVGGEVKDTGRAEGEGAVGESGEETAGESGAVAAGESGAVAAGESGAVAAGESGTVAAGELGTVAAEGSGAVAEAKGDKPSA